MVNTMDTKDFLEFRKGVLQHALECKKTGRFHSGFQSESIEQIEARIKEINVMLEAVRGVI